MLVQFDESDGSVVIEFGYGAEPNPVRLYPPTWGGFQRLRAEQSRIARQSANAITAIQAEAQAEPEPPTDASDEETARYGEELAARAEERIERMSAARSDAVIAFWRLVMLGDDTYKARTDHRPPEDPLDWPPGLIFDYRPVSANGQGATQELPFIDRVLLFWGKALSRSSSVASPG